jgi:formiminoglutamase
MNPDYDIDNRTAKLAARLIYEALGSKFNKL